MLDDIVKAQERLLTVSFDQARAYSQVVLGVGYVGIFASWGFTREFLTRGEILWSALLVCTSIIFFVLFDVFTAFMTSRTILGLASAVQDPARFVQTIEAQKEKDRKWSLRYARAWAVCWPISFVSGVASAGILMKAFVVHLLSCH